MNTILASLVTAIVLTAAPAAADETPAPSPVDMGTIYVQTYEGPAPEVTIPSEVITMDAPVAYSPVIARGVVAYRHQVRRAFTVDGVVYLTRTGVRVGPRTAATFHLVKL